MFGFLGNNTVAQLVHTFETCGPFQVATTITSVDTSSATGYLVKYKATVAETFFMSVQMNGFNIKGSVFAGVAVLPGSADPTKFIVGIGKKSSLDISKRSTAQRTADYT